MRNYRIYLPGFRDLGEYTEYDHYSLNTRLYFKSDYQDKDGFIIPVKRVKKR